MQEFSIEIPDKEADAIHSGTFSPHDYNVFRYETNTFTVDKAVQYILAQPDGECAMDNHFDSIILIKL